MAESSSSLQECTISPTISLNDQVRLATALAIVRSCPRDQTPQEYLLGLRLLVRSIPPREGREGPRTYALLQLDEAMERSKALKTVMEAMRRGRTG